MPYELNKVLDLSCTDEKYAELWVRLTVMGLCTEGGKKISHEQ